MKKYQAGQLSLLWTAVFIGIVALAGMLLLMSARYERNYFAQAWNRIAGSIAGQAAQELRQTASMPSADTGISRCIIDGKTVYSNIDCANAPGARKLALPDTKGIEPPRAPPVIEPDENKNLREKLIDRAVPQ